MFTERPKHPPSLNCFNLFKQLIFWAVHAACLLAIWVNFSWVALLTCLALYFARMFAITGGYHRYFSHRTYQTSRIFQFILGILGATSAQKGPIWWASHHRHHHKYADTPEDIHSPIASSLYNAHIGWVLSARFADTRCDEVRDLMQYPELIWLDRLHAIPPIILAILVFFWGVWLEKFFPELGTSGFQMLIWGFFISTVLVYHGTFCINSFTHLFGRRRFNTNDHSRNSLLFALITLGEGWHNNHHRYPGSERQGFYWWEIDISHYVLKIFSYLRLVWDLRSPPERIYQEALNNNQTNIG